MPGIFDALPTGMPQYETRQCANGVPTLASGLTDLIPDQLRKQIQQFAFAANGSVPAPPCKQQGPYNFSGQVTLYPHVNALP
jgi:hypothetical protein